jgi:alpha-beta hydrolase superfamily lysophospholipase
MLSAWLADASVLRALLVRGDPVGALRRLALVSVPVVEVALVLLLMACLYQLLRGADRVKHSMVLAGSASAEREPPRDIMRRSFFQNRQGLWIYHHLWWDDREWGFGRAPAGVAILLHGHSEHSKRFAHVASHLNRAGLAVFAMDHQGFGRSEGDRGHVELFEHYVDDVEEFALQVVWGDHAEWRQLPRILVAHSMGGCIAIHCAMRFRKSAHEAHRLAGLLMSAPALHMDPARNTLVLRAAAAVVDRFAPKLPLLAFPSYPSTSFTQLKKHAQADPLNYNGLLRVHHCLELLGGTARALQLAPAFDLPLLILHGEKDLHADIAGSRAFFADISSEDKTLVIFPELQHEPWQEEKFIRDQVLDLSVSWAVERVAKAQEQAHAQAQAQAQAQSQAPLRSALSQRPRIGSAGSKRSLKSHRSSSFSERSASLSISHLVISSLDSMEADIHRPRPDASPRSAGSAARGDVSDNSDNSDVSAGSAGAGSRSSDSSLAAPLVAEPTSSDAI